MTKLLLNGPINYVKLFNVKTQQTVHIFMDQNINIRTQQKCSQPESKNIDKYLYKLLISTNETIDFFLEIMPSSVNNQFTYYQNDNYLKETNKMFVKLHKNLKNDSVINKIRLHCIDIKDYTYFVSIINNFEKAHNNIIKYDIFNEYTTQYLINIVDKLKFIDDIYHKIITHDTIINKNLSNDLINLESIINSSNNPKNLILNNVFEELLYKILKKYENPEIKKNITQYFTNEFTIMSSKIVEQLYNLIKKNRDLYKKNYELQKKNELYTNIVKLDDDLSRILFNYGIDDYEFNKSNNELYKQMNTILFFLKLLSNVMMDCFFLRRILEKQYIKKSIVYTNSTSSCVYIWFLVKYSDFQIIDTSYINIDKLDNNNPLEDLVNLIKKSNHYSDLYKYLIPLKLTQCIEINPI